MGPLGERVGIAILDPLGLLRRGLAPRDAGKSTGAVRAAGGIFVAHVGEIGVVAGVAVPGVKSHAPHLGLLPRVVDVVGAAALGAVVLRIPHASR